MHASSKPSTHRHRHAEIPQYPDGESEGGFVSHARIREMYVGNAGEHREREERRPGETCTLSRQIAIAHESRSFILYSAQGTRERLDRSALQRVKREWNNARTRERERGTCLDAPREKSMSSVVNYDKCRDCDSAISEVPPTPVPSVAAGDRL